MKTLLTTLFLAGSLTVVFVPQALPDGYTIDTTVKVDSSAVLELVKDWAVTHQAAPPAENGTILDRLAWERSKEVVGETGALPADLSAEWLKTHNLDGDGIPEGWSAWQLELLDNARKLAGLPAHFENSNDLTKWLNQHPPSKSTSTSGGSAATSGGGSGSSTTSAGGGAH